MKAGEQSNFGTRRGPQAQQRLAGSPVVGSGHESGVGGGVVQGTIKRTTRSSTTAGKKIRLDPNAMDCSRLQQQEIKELGVGLQQRLALHDQGQGKGDTQSAKSQEKGSWPMQVGGGLGSKEFQGACYNGKSGHRQRECLLVIV